MTEREILDQIVIPAIKKADAEIPNFKLGTVNESTPLYGPQGSLLDSLNLVSFVFLLENLIEDIMKKKIVITTADVLDTEHPPFANIVTLSQFLKAKIDQAH